MIDWNCRCNQTPCSGLDCGVYLPGRKPRTITVYSVAEAQAIRAKAWATRRENMEHVDMTEITQAYRDTALHLSHSTIAAGEKANQPKG